MFTHYELVFIRAMCLHAIPFFPASPMPEPWASTYAKAGEMIEELMTSGHVCEPGCPPGR